jgi:4-amino-4-deoxy-L-arabinose transferase-like glycosyltransferase
MTQSVRLFTTFILLALGVQFWIILGDATIGEKRQIAALVLALVVGLAACAWPAARNVAFTWLERLRHPSPRARRAFAVVLPILAGVYLLATARSQHRPFVPIIHDEYAYNVQTHMVARGRLWMPPHELADHFESFHLITDRVYAAKYGPGTALLCAPAVWLGQQPWAAILVLAAICVGLIYLVTTDLIDGLAGLAAALALPTLVMFRRTSIDTLSQIPMLFLALVALWAYLHWRRDRSLRWLALTSAAVGWSILTRPVDAVALALPLAIAILLDLPKLPRPQILRAIAISLAAILPFLALQLITNKGITGRWTTLPWAYYAQQNDLYDTLGKIRPGTPPHSLSHLVQKQQFFEDFTIPNYRDKTSKSFAHRLISDRLAPTFILDVPHSLLLVLLPLGLVGVWRNRRWAAAGFLVTFLVLYAQYTYFVAHYTIVAAAAVLILILSGYDALANGLPRAWHQPSRIIAGLALLALTLTAYPQLLREPPEDEWPNAPEIQTIERHLATIGNQPSVVLFAFSQEANTHIEPVYNAATAWPDDARLIRAHDLGPEKNRAIFRYYAARTPDRRFYRYDRAPAAQGNPLTFLGTARDLAAR